MASLDQISRTLGFTRGLTVPLWIQQYTPLVSAGLFLAIVPFPKVLLESSGLALAVFLLSELGLAFLGGVILKGKSGWCTQFCPMLQVERFYGQSPLLVVRKQPLAPLRRLQQKLLRLQPDGGLPGRSARRKPKAGGQP